MKSNSFSLFEGAIKSEQTRMVYTYSLHEFMKFSKIKEYNDIPNHTTEQIQKLLESWVLHLKKNGLKALTIRAKLNAVELFLEMNKIQFYKKILHRLIPSSDYVAGGDVPFTTEEIQKMLAGTTKLRSKALIHFLASTGARPASITDPVLRLKHLEDMSNGCKAVKIYDGSKQGYWAFLTPEATKALDNYLDSRKRNGEKLDQDSPVFGNLTNNTYGKKNDHMSTKSIRQLVSNVLETAGIDRTKLGNRFDKAPVYGFRKRFNTILKLNNNVNSNIAEKLMAHKRGLDGSYLKPTKEECFIEFMKAIPELTISDEDRNKFKIVKLEEEKSELEKLKLEVSGIKKELEEEVEARGAITHYYAYGDKEDLKKVDPSLIEFWGYWEALEASGNLPQSFTIAKEQLIEKAKHFPKLSKLIGKNGENLEPKGKVWQVRQSNIK